MKNPILLALIIFFLINSCNEPEQPIPEIDENLEEFQRVEHFLFNYGGSDVQRIKVFGDRLIFAHRNNPGYINSTGEVIQLCCLMTNNMDFRQSFSSKYIVAADRSLSVFNVYDINESRNGVLVLNRSIPFQNSVQVNTNHFQSNFDLNDDFLITSLTVDGISRIYIFDLKVHFSLNGPIDAPEPTLVDIQSNFPQIGPRFLKVDAFEDGWIASVSSGDISSTGTYFIRKDGSFELLFPFGDFSYSDHAYTKDGRLLLGGQREIRISENESIDRFYGKLTSENNFRFQLIDDRLVIWNPEFAGLYEVEGYKEQGEIVLKVINNRGIEFSKLNDLAEFNGKVYLATSQGLFTKSLEGFWDFLPDEETSNSALDFINQVHIIGEK